jgi:hypothetical protein
MWSDSHLDRYRDADMVIKAASADKSALYHLLRWATDSALDRATAQQVSWPTPSDAGIRRVPLEQYKKNLDKIYTAALEHGVSAIALGLTHGGWVEAGNTEDGSSSPYIQMLRDVSKARGVNYVEGTTAFTEYQGNEPLFLDNLHPTATGQDLLGAAVAKSLIAAGWPNTKLLPSAQESDVAVPEDAWDGKTSAPGNTMLELVGGNPAERTTAIRQGLPVAGPPAGAAPPQGSNPGMQPGMQMQPGMPMQPGMQPGMQHTPPPGR